MAGSDNPGQLGKANCLDYVSICNREGEAVSFCAHRRVWPVVAIAAMAAACATASNDQKRVVASYDPFTRQLIQLSADQNGDGRIDQITYLDGNRPLRGEGDADGDGRID